MPMRLESPIQALLHADRPVSTARSATTTAATDDGIEHIDLSAGLDGMLYGLVGEATVRVYDPVSVALQRTVMLSRNVRGIAVDASGEMFGASWDGNLYRFSASGSFRTSGDEGPLVGSSADGL